jgi:lipoate-protein ligase A
MAIDAALLADVEASSDPRTIVRFYSWSRPTISLGRNQNVDAAVDRSFCQAKGIDVVHRPTGGRAVLHDDELTYAVVSNDSSYFGDTIYGNYKRVSEALCVGFNRLGVPAFLSPDTRKPAALRNGADPPCFLSTSRYELMVEGRKIVGSAQRRVRRSFLQHGSMPIRCDRQMLAQATRMTDASLLDQEMAGLAEFVSPLMNVEELPGIFANAFQDHFSIQFQLGSSDEYY